MEPITPCVIAMIVGIYIYGQIMTWIFELVEEIKKELRDSRKKKGGKQS